MPRTAVALHAHPDDEALLTAGTLAKAAAAGHRVVIAVATDGDQGLTSAGNRDDGALGARRLAELEASGRALGVARVVHLGYGDSGMVGDIPPDAPGRPRFCRVDRSQAARRVADLLRDESADVLLSYDAAGGYGHRDHVRVHEVGRLATRLLAQEGAAPRLLEATIPRELIARTVELVGKVYRYPPDFDPTSFRRSFTPRARITHRIDVRRQSAAKRASMAAHATQAAADDGADRTLAAFLRLPRPLFALVFGTEWYVDPAAPPLGEGAASGRAGRLATDIFAGLPPSARR